MTRAEERARKTIGMMSTEKILEIWEETERNNDPHIPTVRGWIMDEIEKRNPEGFDKWLDCDAEDSTLRDYII